MRRLSGVLVSYNEEAKIEAALHSLSRVCDEVVVVDSLSTDSTVDICRRFTERIHARPWQGYQKQKQFATEQAENDWVLSLDADEELSEEAQAEILDWKKAELLDCDGYLIPRISFFLGRWIRHTAWYPDWQLRLFRKSRGRWVGGRVHESFHVLGKTGRLSGHIRHYSYASVSEYLDQLERFSTLAAEDYLERGKRVRLGHLVLSPPLIFLRSYVARLGFLDGIPGLVVSALAATSNFFKYLKVWEAQRNGTRGSR